MKVLLTGATGYIGKRLLPVLVEQGHHVICCVREKKRFNPPKSLQGNITLIEIDLLDYSSLKNIPNDIDVAYYLVHSMSSAKHYASLEQKSAINFRNALLGTRIKQVIYLSGIVNERLLSEHLLSRKTVEHELKKGDYHFTCLRAGIIIGSGSASFEIIRDLVEKLPVMITPKWLLTKCQPIGISDVILFLDRCKLEKRTFDQNYDIGCDDILTYKEMLLGYAQVRNLKRSIWTIPLMTPKLSSYWLYFVTSTSYSLATSLVNSMKIEVVCRDNKLNNLLDVHPISYRESLKRAFKKIDNNEIVSSWKDAYESSGTKINISEFITVPTHGCYKDKRVSSIINRELCIKKIWSIGGDNGWYYGNWLWRIRGFIDKLIGGVGLRRGRTNQTTISTGDSLDFWRVIYANKEEGRLLLFAEMKMPGEAWLEFKIEGDSLSQIATFRPLGMVGRLYWYSVYPFHGIIFKGLIKYLSKDENVHPS